MTKILIRDITVTIGVMILVILMPAIDRIVCQRTGLNVRKGLSRSRQSMKLKTARMIILCMILAVYIAGVVWLVFFSRSAADDYRINDTLGFGTIDISSYAAAQQTFRTMSHIYLNLMMFVPLGYLLPYVFGFFRRNIVWRSTFTGFIMSLLIENLQLVTKRGRYELDDLITNTLGALLGVLLYRCIAYVVTHPDWRAERKHAGQIRKQNLHTVLGPLYKHTRVSRAILYASDQAAIEDFYVRKLGFESVTKDGRTLLKLGPARVEVIYTNENSKLSDQDLILYAGDIDIVRQRLKNSGIPVTREYEDVFEQKACLCIAGPDDVCVTVIS